MKICPNCGQQLEDADVFCPNCGQNTEAVQENVQPEPQFTPAPQPQYQEPKPLYQAPQPLYQSPQFKAHSAPNETGLNQPILALKRTATSAPFIIGAILFTVSTALSVFISVVASSSLTQIFYGILNAQGINVPLDYSNAVSSVVSPIVSSIPTLLVILGLWLTVGAGGNKNNDRMSTAGLSIIKVIQILSLIGMCICFGILFIASIIGIFVFGLSINDRSYAVPGIGASISGIVILIGVFVFALIFYIKVIKMIGAAKRVAVTGMPVNGGSGFVAVMLFIAGILGIVTAIMLLLFSSFLADMLSSLGSGIGVSSSDVDVLISGFSILGGVSILVSSLANIFFGITIFKFKGAMNRLSGR